VLFLHCDLLQYVDVAYLSASRRFVTSPLRYPLSASATVGMFRDGTRCTASHARSGCVFAATAQLFEKVAESCHSVVTLSSIFMYPVAVIAIEPSLLVAAGRP